MIMRISVKLAGILCILAAGVLAGNGMERRMKRRWQLFREMRETIAFLEKEMGYYRAPLHEALRSAAQRCRTELGTVLSETAEQIEQRSGCSFREIWERNLAKQIPAGLLSREETQLFADTETAFCGTDVVIQRTLLEKYEDRFRMMEDTEARVCSEKGGLYRKLAAAAGVFLVILLL